MKVKSCLFSLLLYSVFVLCYWYYSLNNKGIYDIALNGLRTLQGHMSYSRAYSAVEDTEALTENTYHLCLDKRREVAQSDTILYNRVPKCGSTSTQQATRAVQFQRNFTANISHIYHENHLSSSEIKYLISELQQLEKPWFYSRHIHFIDFQKYNSSLNPVYINLVRDPVNRYQSRFYFRDYMTRLHDYMTLNTCIESKEPACTELSVENETLVYIPFFCGQDDYCLTANTKALNQAKVNIIKHYAVVGILEEFTWFLKILELILPKFYTGVLQTVNPSLRKNRRYKPESISSDNRRVMMDMLNMEYNLYEFIKQRFYNLFCRIINQSFTKHTT